jgi:enoyl-[acyl-carrier-protein] reductase (NADH)
VAPTVELPPINLNRRPIQPDEIASLVTFLASEQSAAITGSGHIIDLGITAA